MNKLNMFRNLFFVYICTCLSYVACDILGISEGSKCNWKNADGVCVPVYRCLSAEYDILNDNSPPICEFHGTEPIICCTDCELVDDSRKIVYDDKLGFFQKNGQKAHDNCINYMHRLPYKCKSVAVSARSSVLRPDASCYIHKSEDIYSARNAVGEFTIDQSPHNVLLVKNETIERWSRLCGGSIISHHFVVSVAHCVAEPPLFVLAGISASRDKWQKYRVNRVITHPDYTGLITYHDIALIKTTTPIIFSDKVMPACLVQPTPLFGPQWDKSDENGIAPIWDIQSKENQTIIAEKIQIDSLQKFSQKRCTEEFKPHRKLTTGYNHTTQMCYGRQGKNKTRDDCKEIRGGPLHIQSVCAPILLGVTMYGRACGISNHAGLYTRISFYLPWIESIVWP